MHACCMHAGYAEGVKLASLAPPAHAVAAPCRYYGPCGGCTLQGLAYEAQLAEKHNQVRRRPALCTRPNA